MLSQRYHLPHNSVRIDEFNHMLDSIDLNKEYYFYDELRLEFLKSQITDGSIARFHPAYHKNLSGHSNPYIKTLYEDATKNPTNEKLNELLNCQYTSKKTFKQVFNETVRDYTEFFAFLGLLTTYYKGRTGGEKKHYVTQRLKDYRTKKITLEELLLEFRYRNSSKDYENLSMYSITVRPFCIALKALRYYFEHGYEKVDNQILSAIVTYAHSEDITNLLNLFSDPTKTIDFYENSFGSGDFAKIKKELTRATILLRPYLLYMQYVDRDKRFYIRGSKDISSNVFTNRAAYCNSDIGNVALTPVIGKMLYKLYTCAKRNVHKITLSELFDENVSENDKDFLIDEFRNLGVIGESNEEEVSIANFEKQISINPFTEFFEIDDCNYVEGGLLQTFSSGEIVVKRKNVAMEHDLDSLKSIALGSNGTLYEESMFKLIQTHLPIFNTVWYGANSVGKRLSDIVVRTKIRDDHGTKNILIIIECKAGNAIRSFDERKEKDDIQNTLIREKQLGTPIDGVWYWVVDSNSLPNVDSHGGYRSNQESRSFVEKLNAIQFDVSEYMRVPTIVTAFSYEAIRTYMAYLNEKIGNLSSTPISKVDVPHFWRWSKQFMNLQYVMVHKELRLTV